MTLTDISRPDGRAIGILGHPTVLTSSSLLSLKRVSGTFSMGTVRISSSPRESVGCGAVSTIQSTDGVRFIMMEEASGMLRRGRCVEITQLAWSLFLCLRGWAVYWSFLSQPTWSRSGYTTLY